MPTTNPEEANKVIGKFLEFSSPKQARKVIMKLYFNVDKKLISEMDEEEIFLLYNLFEDLSEN